MSHTQRCVLPEECACDVAGVRYWPGQQIKVDCEICVCERGRPQSCQPNPDCSGEFLQTYLVPFYRLHLNDEKTEVKLFDTSKVHADLGPQSATSLVTISDLMHRLNQRLSETISFSASV